MKILFSATHFGFLRNFQSTIRLLAEQGHELHLLAERRDAIDGQKMADVLTAEHPSITVEILPSSRHRLWYALATGVRASLDYWRYLDPRWDDAPKLRGRAMAQAPAFAAAAARMPLLRTRTGLAFLQKIFRGIDRATPPSDEITDVFGRLHPDVLLLTPLLYFRSHQVDHVRAARRLGIKTVLGVGSWDHLTTKGLIHEIPDRVLVWNAAQKLEAMELHGVPADRVAVTGAQAYDHWFTMQPSLERVAFCDQVGLDFRRPILLYLCSSPFIAPYEVGFVRRWMTAIRGSAEPRLRTAGLLVRPHPQNAGQWQGVDLGAEFENVAVWPRTGVNPIGGAARSDYFDSMYHAEGVVGINTSGMIESGIIGRPVYSIKTEEFATTQEGTLHFQHLTTVEGGLLHLAADLEEHVGQLARLLTDAGEARERAGRFIAAFVRPHGLDVPATPRVVGELERLVAGPALALPSTSIGTRVLRLSLLPVAVVATVMTLERSKLRAMVLHWTRPARLAFRAVMSRLVYAARFIRRLPGLMLRLAKYGIRLVVIRPVFWTLNRGKMALHAVLVRRHGRPGAEASPRGDQDAAHPIRDHVS